MSRDNECCTKCKYLRRFIPWDCENKYNKPLPNHSKEMFCCIVLDEEVMQVYEPDTGMCELFTENDLGDYPDEIPDQFDNMTGSMNL